MCSMFFPRSSSSTLRPLSESSFAAHPPEIPEPTTIASYVVLCTCCLPSLEIPVLQLTDRKIRGASCERHIRERWIHARCRYHARPIGDEDVRRIPDLIVPVEHRRLGVASHARGPHLMNTHAWEITAVICLHFLDTG